MALVACKAIKGDEMERDSYQLNAHLKELKPYLLEGLRAGQEYVGLWCDQVGFEECPTLQWSFARSYEPVEMDFGATSEFLVFESDEDSHPLLSRALDPMVGLIDSSFSPEPLLMMRSILATGDWIRIYDSDFTDEMLPQVVSHMNSSSIATVAPYVFPRGPVVEVISVSPVMEHGRSNATCFMGQFFRSALELLTAIKMTREEAA